MQNPQPDLQDDTLAREQAALWLSRLHSGERTQHEVDAFYHWLQQSQVHQNAFDAVTTSWELAGSLHDIPRENLKTQGISRRAVLASACVLGASGAGAAYWAWPQNPTTYSSDVGEIRRVTLADGSRLVLDTSSTVDVLLAKHKRQVTLLGGRAHVEVAKDADRPFSVEAADQQVIARGTVFDVALIDTGMQVLLTEGLVDVVGKSGTRNSLIPGQRLSYADGGIRIDQPDPRKLAAWQTGRLIFDNDTLDNAVAQINRYDRRKIVLKDPAVRGYRVSGSYATGNTRLFAQSISQLLGIRLEETAGQILMHRDDASNAASSGAQT